MWVISADLLEDSNVSASEIEDSLAPLKLAERRWIAVAGRAKRRLLRLRFAEIS